MTFLGRLLLGLAHLALTLPVVAALGVAALVALTLPGGSQSARIPGLSGPASIELDADGVARIHAATARDAAAALGYAHARERMFQMELMRRAASGTLSEIAGPATLRLDRLMRVLGLRRAAEADLAGLDASTRDMLDAYAAGVNARIAERGRSIGLESVLFGRPAPWTPVDSLLWGKTMALYLSGNWHTELARLALFPKLGRAGVDALWPSPPGTGPIAMSDPRLPALATRLAAAVPAFPAPFTLPDEASNAWAVDGRHSASGAPLLAGDPHLAFGLPGIWYLARIETPEGVLAGATAPGVPMLVLGHNGHVAWSFTTTGADTQDLFVETPAGDGTYATPDGPQPILSRSEHITVAGHSDDVLTVRSTRHGPLVSDLVDPTGPMLALSAVDQMPGDTAASGLLALNRAQDVDQAGVAAGRISAPVQNLVVADRARIGFFVTGRVPVRRSGDGAWPQQGADGGHDWVGFASGAQLPHAVAPESGALVNANDRVAIPGFDVFLARDWYESFRAARIRELLGAGTHTVSDFAAMQADTQDRFFADIRAAALLTAPRDDPSRQALALLRDWDGRMAMDAPQPLIVTAWMRRLAADRLARSGVDAAHDAAVAPWPDIAANSLLHQHCAGDCATLLADSLAGALHDLAAAYGPDPAAWRWGAAHQAVFAHPLLRAIPQLGALVEARIASPGGETTVDRGGLRPGSFESVHGASFRGAYDLADLDHSLFVVAPGQSGHVASPLARNFVARWRDGTSIMLGPYAPPAARITLEPGDTP